MINGLGFDPTARVRINPHRVLFPDWREKISTYTNKEWEGFGFGWCSGSMIDPKTWARSFGSGYWNPSHMSWSLASEAAVVLAMNIEVAIERNKDVCLLAHSLGTRVALLSLAQLPESSVKRAVLLNGSEFGEIADAIASSTNTSVLNVAIKSDLALRIFDKVAGPTKFFGSTVGRVGIVEERANWVDIFLDDPAVQFRAQSFGYDYCFGGKTDKITAHSHSFKHPMFWALYGDFIRGKLSISELREIAGDRATS